MTTISFTPKYVGIYGGDLVTPGCGCCEHYEPATKENLEEAIKDTKEFLAVLEKLLIAATTNT